MLGGFRLAATVSGDVHISFGNKNIVSRHGKITTDILQRYKVSIRYIAEKREKLTFSNGSDDGASFFIFWLFFFLVVDLAASFAAVFEVVFEAVFEAVFGRGQFKVESG